MSTEKNREYKAVVVNRFAKMTTPRVMRTQRCTIYSTFNYILFLEMNCVLVLFFCAATLAFPQSKGELKFIYALGGLFSIYGEHILKPIYPQLS